MVKRKEFPLKASEKGEVLWGGKYGWPLREDMFQTLKRCYMMPTYKGNG